MQDPYSLGSYRSVRDGYKCDDKLTMEPRLIEYLEKKQYFFDNDIEASVSLEQQYQITDYDKKVIKNFMKGKRQPYKNGDFIDPSGQIFPSSEFKQDARLDRLKNKVKKDNDAQFQRHNNSILKQSYDMYRPDRNFASMMGNDMSNKFNDNRFDELMHNGRENKQSNMFHDDSMFMLDSRDFANNDNMLKPRKSSRQTYTHTAPRVQNDLYLPPQQLTDSRRSKYTKPIDHNPDFNEFIGKSNSYKQKLSRAEIQMNDVSYMPMNGELRDIDIENCMRTGSTTSKAKTNGYRNPFEHYFQYIDGEIQKPEHTVFERGMPTRLLNKEFAKKTKKREIF